MGDEKPCMVFGCQRVCTCRGGFVERREKCGGRDSCHGIFIYEAEGVFCESLVMKLA